MRWNETNYSGWGRALVANGRIARPEKMAALSDIFVHGPAPAVGNRRSYGDAAQNSGGDVIDMTRLNRLLSFDAGTGLLEVEAGATIGEILQIFAPKGWLPAVVPGTGFATVGGCIANDVHGKNHHVHGTFGNFVDSLELLKPDGQHLQVSRKRNKALFLATLGGLGQTGIILTARLRLVPCSSASMQVSERRIETLGEFIEAFRASDAEYSVGWIDATAKGRRLGRGILEEAEIARNDAPAPTAKPRSVPFDAPGFALSPMIVRAFNRWYFARVPHDGSDGLRPMQEFFFPLDRIHDWNRLYGKAGFHQFQCVVPHETAEQALGDMLRLVSKSGRASPLAVLKLLGPQGDGMLSFPTEGFTLAVDLRNRGDIEGLIAKLGQLAVQAGGRVYPAKDSLGNAEAFAQSYPNLPAFQDVVEKQDPGQKLATDLVRRLGIRSMR